MPVINTKNVYNVVYTFDRTGVARTQFAICAASKQRVLADLGSSLHHRILRSLGNNNCPGCPEVLSVPTSLGRDPLRKSQWLRCIGPDTRCVHRIARPDNENHDVRSFVVAATGHLFEACLRDLFGPFNIQPGSDGPVTPKANTAVREQWEHGFQLVFPVWDGTRVQLFAFRPWNPLFGAPICAAYRGHGLQLPWPDVASVDFYGGSGPVQPCPWFVPRSAHGYPSGGSPGRGFVPVTEVRSPGAFLGFASASNSGLFWNEKTGYDHAMWRTDADIDGAYEPTGYIAGDVTPYPVCPITSAADIGLYHCDGPMLPEDQAVYDDLSVVTRVVDALDNAVVDNRAAYGVLSGVVINTDGLGMRRMRPHESRIYNGRAAYVYDYGVGQLHERFSNSQAQSMQELASFRTTKRCAEQGNRQVDVSIARVHLVVHPTGGPSMTTVVHGVTYSLLEEVVRAMLGVTIVGRQSYDQPNAAYWEHFAHGSRLCVKFIGDHEAGVLYTWYFRISPNDAIETMLVSYGEAGLASKWRDDHADYYREEYGGIRPVYPPWLATFANNQFRLHAGVRIPRHYRVADEHGIRVMQPAPHPPIAIVSDVSPDFDGQRFQCDFKVTKVPGVDLAPEVEHLGTGMGSLSVDSM